MSIPNTVVIIVEMDETQEKKFVKSIPDGVRFRVRHMTSMLENVIIRDDHDDMEYRLAHAIVNQLREAINR